MASLLSRLVSPFLSRLSSSARGDRHLLFRLAGKEWRGVNKWRPVNKWWRVNNWRRDGLTNETVLLMPVSFLWSRRLASPLSSRLSAHLSARVPSRLSAKNFWRVSAKTKQNDDGDRPLFHSENVNVVDRWFLGKCLLKALGSFCF